MYNNIFSILNNSIRFINRNMGFFYAVHKGRKPGVYLTWDECKAQVHQFTGARYKKFPTRTEADKFVKNPAFQSTSTESNTSSKRSYSATALTKELDSVQQVIKKRKTELIEIQSPLNTIRTLMNDQYFEVDSDGYVNVWTDGACSKNGMNNSKAGIGVFFGFNNALNISSPVIERSTNNYAEIKAVTEAANQASTFGVNKLQINTDSKFLINCITIWMPKWKKNNWKTSSGQPVINKKELIEMEKALDKIKSIKWNHVRGHAGNCGNEMADQLARQGAEKA